MIDCNQCCQSLKFFVSELGLIVTLYDLWKSNITKQGVEEACSHSSILLLHDS